MSHDVEVFYADPVDENGKVIGYVGPFTVSALWTDDVVVVKVPHDEIVIDADAIHVKVPSKEEG